MSGKLIRRISLWFVILCGLGFVVLLWIGYRQFKPMIVPAVIFTTLYIVVLIGEVWGATTGVKKTLSTRYKEWTQENQALSWIALGLFWTAMSALVIHLGVFW